MLVSFTHEFLILKKLLRRSVCFYRRSVNEVRPPPFRVGGAIQPNGYAKSDPPSERGGFYFIH
eukprot:UN14160